MIKSTDCSAIDVLLVDDSLRETHTAKTVLATTDAACNDGGVRSVNEAHARLITSRSDFSLVGSSSPDSQPRDTVANLRRSAPLVPTIRLAKDGEEQRKKLTQENTRLAELNEATQKLIDNVSHEFRTPLSVIMEYVTLIRDGMVSSALEQQRMLRVIGDRIDDLNRMVDNMLDVSRLSAGILHVWRRVHSPAEIVAQIATPLTTKAELRRLNLTFDVPNDLPDVFCDADKIGRALTNLTVNAIKHCGVPGRVQIKARSTPDERSVRFYVTDSGGTDGTERQSTFDRFPQLDNNLRGSSRCYGLGFDIVKELIEINLGTLRARNKPGIGSTFSFTVPLANVNEIVRRYIDWYAGAEAGSTITLLVATIDDGHDAARRNEVDALLNYMLQGNDLSVPIGANRWGIIAKADGNEAGLLVERYDVTWKEANRNRPSAALPPLDVTIAGTWHVPQDTAVVLRTVEQLICEPFVMTNK